jgi:ketosteroid isomerase-like protein
MTTQILHPNIETLRAIYADLSRIDRYCDDDVVLHTADRGASGRPAQAVGKAAVLRHELDLISMTENTLVMEVQHIIADDHFGAVMGILQADSVGRKIGMPFCGLWRFRNGRVIEHWENAYDAPALGRFFAGDMSGLAPWILPS